MKKYKVKITEILEHVEEIETESEEKALEIVEDMYRNCEIVLDYSSYVSTDFKVVK